MAQADLECYDENGFVTLTAATLFGRVMATVATGTANGSLYVPGLTTSGADYWYMTSIVSAPNINCLPRISIANDTISWQFVDFSMGPNNAPRLGCTIIAGTD